VRLAWSSVRAAAQILFYCPFEFSGAFAKLRKATINFAMSVCPSHGTIQLPRDGRPLNLIFYIFRKTVEKIQVPFKSDKNNGYFT